MSNHPAEQIVCPSCRRPPEAWSVEPESLRCTNPVCGRIYPRVHPRIPIVAPGPLDPYLAADAVGDLEPDELLRERLGQLEAGSEAWDALFRATMYAVSHYVERPNPFTRLCDALLPQIAEPVRQAVDIGCGVGGMALEVAHRTGARVVGLDSSPLSLRWAERAARGVPFDLPVRVTASGYAIQRVDPPVAAAPGRVEWVCADALHPPLAAESFDLALLVNVLDSVRDPWIALGQASALVREGGHVIVAQPDAWMGYIAPSRAWIAEDEAGWEAALARYGLHTVASLDGLDWVVHRTRRMRFGYTLHARLARRGPWPD